MPCCFGYGSFGGRPRRYDPFGKNAGRATKCPVRTPRATVVPPHGAGKLVPTFPPGVSGNPGRRPARLREVQKLAREKSMTALKALIGLVEDVDANGVPNQDGRIVVVAAQTF